MARLIFNWNAITQTKNYFRGNVSNELRLVSYVIAEII